MKPSYSGFEAKENKGFIDLPQPGAYVAEIQDVRFVPADGDKQQRDVIEMMMEIIEGEYKNRYHDLYKDSDEKFGNAKYKGIFRLTPPTESDEDWRRRNFEGALWCVEQSNPGYSWDWDEKKLKGKKVGISVRKRLYTYDGKDKETTEIAKFETVSDVREGKCKIMKPRDQRENRNEEPAADSQGFTPVESSSVNVPW